MTKRKELLTGVERLASGRYRAWLPAGSSGKRKWLPSALSAELADGTRAHAMKLLRDLPSEVSTLGRAVEPISEDHRHNGQTGTLRWFADQATVLTSYSGEEYALEKLTANHLRKFKDAKSAEVQLSSALHYKRALSSCVSSTCQRWDQTPATY